MADTCPKCGATELASDKCPGCGVIIPLYEQALAKFRREAPSGTAVAMPAPPPRAPSQPRPAATVSSATRRFSFHGQGGTLFGIQIVNVALTLVTLGIYSFWAKVRVRRYLVGQSAAEGDRFAYHGTAPELIRGFLRALVYFGVPMSALQAAAAFGSEPWASLASVTASLLLVVVVPMAMVGARRYRLSRTSWRAIRFAFDGAAGDYLKLFVGGSLLTAVTLGLYYPIFHVKSQAFMVSHSRFGQRRFGFDGLPRETFTPFLLSALLLIPTLGLSFVWHIAWRRRYYWGHTTLDGARFRYNATGRQLFTLYATDALLLLVTLGIAWPWVRMRNARFTFDALTLEGPIDLDAIAQTAGLTSATGDALSSFLGTGFDV